MSVSGLERTARIENPETVAIRALGFLSVRRPLFDRFLQTSGVPYVLFARRPIASELAIAVLDFLVADEIALIEFTERTDIAVEAIYATRRMFTVREDAAQRDGVTLASITPIFDAVREPAVVEAGWATHARRLPQVSGSKPSV
jgi:hypothetical protein